MYIVLGFQCARCAPSNLVLLYVSRLWSQNETRSESYSDPILNRNARLRIVVRSEVLLLKRNVMFWRCLVMSSYLSDRDLGLNEGDLLPSSTSIRLGLESLESKWVMVRWSWWCGWWWGWWLPGGWGWWRRSWLLHLLDTALLPGVVP